MTSHREQRELDELLSQMIDSGLESEQQSRLAELLRRDPAARARYHDQLALHTVLYWKSDRSLSTAEAHEAATSAPRTVPVRAARGGALGWLNQPSVFSLIFAAAFLWAGLTLLAVWRSSGPPETRRPATPIAAQPRDAAWATLTAVAQCRWGEGSLSTELSSRWSAGRRELLAGVAEIKFDNGVVLWLEGPASFALDSVMSVELSGGRLVARVPKAAQGFVVQTPHARVVDLGTEFGVFVAPEEMTQVEVFQGKVEIAPQAKVGARVAAERRVLIAGESVQVAAGRTLPAQPADAAWAFARPSSARLQTALRKPDQVVIAAEDTYVESGMPDRAFGEAPQLLVKHDLSYTFYDRQAWLRFDLAGIDRERIQAARLLLTPIPGPRKISQPPPDPENYTLEVAGLKDAAQNRWDEQEWNWATASRAILQPLVPFELEGPGAIGLPLAVEGEALTEYLRTFPAEQATLVVRRLTAGMQFAHAFASRENPRYPAAQLQIWYTTQAGAAETPDSARPRPAPTK